MSALDELMTKKLHPMVRELVRERTRLHIEKGVPADRALMEAIKETQRDVATELARRGVPTTMDSEVGHVG
jgi:hypothetical protein